MIKNYSPYLTGLRYFVSFVFLMLISVVCFSQTITLSVRNAPLQKVMDAVKKQTKFSVISNKNLLNSAPNVTISVVNEPLTSFLTKVFKDQPSVYSIEDRTIIISPKENKNPVPKVQEPTVDVNGKVMNKKSGEPLGAVSVKVKGIRTATSTTLKGEFYVPKQSYKSVLVFTSVGFDSLQVHLNEYRDMQEGNVLSAKNLTIRKTDYGYSLSVSLDPAVSYLDEVMVQGYGTTDRRTGTGNVARISAKELEQQPVSNPLLALQGRVPGMIVSPTNGYASSPVKIEIRGRKNIGDSFVSDPMYIIDGVPLTNLDLSGSSSDYKRGSMGVIQNGLVTTTGGQSPLYNLNSRDIESIEVLKDGDATAIYGSRAANGVILITTKKGKPGATKFSANLEQGFSAITQYSSMLNTQQYLQVRRDAFKNDNLQPTATTAPDLVTWDSTKYTDWQKKLWNHIGKQINASMGVSGGDAQTQFRISANYGRQTEILTTRGSNQRASFAFNMSHSTLNRKFKIQLNTIYTYSAIDAIASPGLATLPPNAPDIYNTDGTLNFAPWRTAGYYDFPFTSLEMPYYSNTHLMTSNLNLSYEIAHNLTFSTNFGYNSTSNNQKNYIPIRAQDPIYNPTGVAFFGTNTNMNWIIEPQINYSLKLGEGKLTALVGASLQKTITRGAGTLGTGYENDEFIESINLAKESSTTENQGYYKYAAVFGRINYNWQDKYIININGRRDGSSRFGPGNQYGNFGSIGAAWLMSNEDWIKDHLPSFISFMKLRGSYGLTGSDGVGDYQYLTKWSKNPAGTVWYDYDGSTPLVSGQAVNQNYKWQVNKKLEGAFSIGFLESKINLEVALYRDRCGNQLTRYPTPFYTGFPSVTANWPAVVDNKGFEISINANLINTENFNWTMTLNGSRNSNILKDYPNIQNSPYASTLKIGESINTVYLYHYTGVDPLTGNYTFEDRNRDGVVSGDDPRGPGIGDKYVRMDLSPKFSGGIGNTFTYKKFSLSCFFDFKNQMFTDPVSSYGTIIGGLNNQPTAILGNYWKAPGDQVKYAKPSTISNQGNMMYLSSDAKYVSASYIRLNNIALSYTLDQKIAKKIGAESLRVYMNAQNIFVLTNAKGIDPDLQQFGSLPPARILLCGLSLNF